MSSPRVHVGLWSGLAACLGLLACGDAGGLPDARVLDAAPPPGTFSLSWTVDDGAATISCEDVGAVAVSVDIIEQSAGAGVTDAFLCATGGGTSRLLAPGTYDLRVVLTGSGGVLAEPQQLRGVVVDPADDTTLDPLTFTVDPTGGLRFRIAATEGNCTPIAEGGAGITATELVLRADGACVPTTFAIAAGATAPAGSYVSDCAGATFACIARDQDVTATGLRSGPYTLTVTGEVDGTACWSRVAQFQVPAAGAVTSLPTQNLVRADVPACAPP